MIYPGIENLPLEVDSSSWNWSKADNGEFWIGHDKDGNKWLMKGRGSFYALRERASAYLLQSIGINSQSSSFIILPEDSLPVLEKSDIERYQLAIRYIDEHGENCKAEENCLLKGLHDQFHEASKKVSFLERCYIKNIIDWVKMEVMACLCGANEASGRLFSQDHIMYVIDNEQMFSTIPSNPITYTSWFEIEFDATMKITLDLCEKLSNINERDIKVFTTIPENYVVDELWSIPELMASMVIHAKGFGSFVKKLKK